jgi:hypothetical protein
VSCSLLVSWLCSFICLSYGDVICGTSCLYSLSCLFYGPMEMSSVVPPTSTPLVVSPMVICGTSYFYSVNCLSYGEPYVVPLTSTRSAIFHVEMSFCSMLGCLYNYWHCLYHCWHCKWFHFALHHFYALTFVLSYFLFIPKLETSPSSTLFFLLKTLIGKFIAAFFYFPTLFASFP